MNRREALRYLVFTGATVASLGSVSSFLGACAKRQLRRERLAGDRYGVTILVDGLREDLFSELLGAGALPNIRKHLVERGTLVETCVSTFPSTTGPAHLPFITGVMPGYNDCPGLRWVDRRHRTLRDYCTMHNILFNADFPKPNLTLYEVLSDVRTACIFDFVSRGASEVVNVPAKTLWFMLTGEMDVWSKMDGYAVDAFRTLYAGGAAPSYSFVWMPAIDHLAHFHGSRDRVILERAEDVDKQVGRIMTTLQDRHLYDRTLVSLVVDHGLSDTALHLDIRDTLEKYGLNVLENLTDNDQFNSLSQNNAARGVSGNSFALLCFAARKEGRLSTASYDWTRKLEYGELRSFPVGGSTRIDLVDLLRREEGIGLVMAREKEDTVLIFSGKGEGRIERDYSSLRYSFSRQDPLRYAENPECAALMDGKNHDKDDWFLATRKTEYPDGLFQIAQLFDAPRCGDIVVTAKPGWDLMDQGHKASHGSLERTHLHVPCVIAGPGVKQGTIPIARTVDMYPTYLKFLGIPHYDGEVRNVFL
jgi:predicted AlkP superfamily pyrophosphatase or phosphodiesterase